MHVPSGLLSSFVTLFVTIGPIETAFIFVGLTSGIHNKERRSLALRSVTIAGLLLFAVGGNSVLSLLPVSLPAGFRHDLQPNAGGFGLGSTLAHSNSICV
jgi:multiple antibiotic resistance protein